MKELELIVFNSSVVTARGDYFFFRTERGRLFEGGDYFKYFSQEVVILFYYIMKSKN